VNDFATWLAPTQMKVIPGCQSKTPVAQMRFCLGAPPVQGKPWHQWLIVIIQTNFGRALFFYGLEFEVGAAPLRP
jgi:hypothetical protein